MDEVARLIAIAVANVGAVVDPSLIVLGGALFAQAESLVHDVRKIVERIRRSPMEIVSSALGKDAPLSGCLLVASNEASAAAPPCVSGKRASWWPTGIRSPRAVNVHGVRDAPEPTASVDVQGGRADDPGGGAQLAVGQARGVRRHL